MIFPEQQACYFIKVSYGSFSKESTILYGQICRATQSLTPGASSLPGQFSFFLFVFIKTLYQFTVLSFPSHHSCSNSGCFKLFKLLFLVLPSIFLENIHVPLLLAYQL